ncbi:MAG: aldehyde dehydrogenase family protein, partial [Acidovorax sp.]|uniref:aldehyde dehydrogenase family protein n=1 Tax=Acidovorax sp. TaxID=1872122 RepID=UPI0039197B17
HAPHLGSMILKPSEKVPLTLRRVAELLKEAGVPDGVFQVRAQRVAAVCGSVTHHARNCRL